MSNTQRRSAVVSAVLGLALLAAACSPTPTRTPVVILSAVTATATRTQAAVQPATATATATEIFIPDDTNSEATAVGTAGTPPALDACDLITDSEAGDILGAPITRAQSGTDTEDVGGYPIHFCTWHSANPNIALILSVADTGSQGASVSQLEAQLAANEDEATVEEDIDAEQAGVGERVFWTVSENAAGFDIATGAHVYALAVGGKVTPTDELRAALLALAKAVSGRL